MDIQESTIKFPSQDAELSAFLARPQAPGPFPGLVVIHEIFGLTEHIKDITRRLACEGYAALAVDLFWQRNLKLCMLQAIAIFAGGGTEHFGTRGLRSGLDYLAQQDFVDAERLGAVGFCMGGNFALGLALHDKRVKAIAPFYGVNPWRLKDFSGFCPVVASFPEDDILTKKDGPQLEAALTRYKIPHDVKIYPGARHSFMDPRRPKAYHPEAAADAWSRTLSFFKEQL